MKIQRLCWSELIELSKIRQTTNWICQWSPMGTHILGNTNQISSNKKQGIVHVVCRQTIDGTTPLRIKDSAPTNLGKTSEPRFQKLQHSTNGHFPLCVSKHKFYRSTKGITTFTCEFPIKKVSQSTINFLV